MEPTPSAAAADAHRRPFGGERGVWALNGAIASTAIGLAVLVRPLEPWVDVFRIPWPALALLFYAAEFAVVHLRFRNDAHTFSMSEVPLVVGLFFASPSELITAQVLANTVVLVVNRRQPPVKFVFNLAQFGVQAGLAVLVFRMIGALGEPFGPAGWIGAIAAALVAMLAADAMINTAIRLAGGKLDATEVAEVLGLGALSAVMNASLALAGVLILWKAPEMAWLTLIPPIVLFMAYRAYSAQRQERDRLESLYQATRVLHESPQIEQALSAATHHACQMFEAEFAEIVVFPQHAHQTAYRTTTTSGRSSEVMVPLHRGVAAAIWDAIGHGSLARQVTKDEGQHWREPGANPIRDGIVAPLNGSDGVTGVIVVANKLGDVSVFEPQDIKLLEALAGQVSVSLENGRLEDSLAQLTELKEQLRHQATHDALTDLANRVLFTERVEQAMLRSERNDRLISVLFIDLDDFKTVNDRYGHAAGDAVLMSVAERLDTSCRAADCIARLGGDEFAVLLEDIDEPSTATAIAERIVRSMRNPFRVAGKEITLHASVGVAFASSGGHPDELLRDADAAMYAAKRRGKGGYQVFESGMHSELIRRIELRAHLRRAIEDQELLLLYQPIVSLDTGEITGVEALVRWPHRELGTLEPSDFIPFAEETGLIVPLGRWVLHEACRLAKEWRAMVTPLGREFSMSVNVSPQQLLAPGMVQDVASSLLEHDLDPNSLVLEITENMLMPAAARRLDELKGLGVGLAVDDFGTGYSSLSYLDRLPIDIIKVDKSFVERLAQEGDDSALVGAVIRIGDSLGMHTVVEGVEARFQAERLKALGCTTVQGYLFSEPLDAAAVTALLQREIDGDLGFELGGTVIPLNG